MNKKIIILLILGVMAVILGGIMFYYEYSLGAVSDDETSVIVEIKEGTNGKEIIDKLYEANLIKNKYTVYFYYKMKGNLNLQAGNYMLNRIMDVENIFQKISSGDTINEVVQITFKEGKWVPKYVSLISEGFGYQESEIYGIISDIAYLKELIDKYWFLTEDILNESIYYPLEGYLYPDTYIFTDENVTVEEIFEKMLDKMDAVITPYKEEIESSNYSVHQILSLASVVELEAKDKDDRYGVASVFVNRLKQGMALQSDVTTYYGLQLAMDERNLTVKELQENNGYNTRSMEMAGKIPVGPICSVSDSSIKAVLNPDETNNLYFVADKNGKVYFSETNEQHEKIQQQLKDDGLWFTYDK